MIHRRFVNVYFRETMNWELVNADYIRSILVTQPQYTNTLPHEVDVRIELNDNRAFDSKMYKNELVDLGMSEVDIFKLTQNQEKEIRKQI